MRAAVLGVLCCLLLVTPAGAAAAEDLDAITVHATVRAAEDDDTGTTTGIIFSAPARVATRTLTEDDVAVLADGQPQQVRVQRLTANDLELAVVVDPGLDAAELRDVQAALVELALQLPPGATMRVVGGGEDPAPAAPVPGPAISAVRQLEPGGGGDLQRAVDRTGAALDESPQRRSALLVVGRDLAARLGPIDAPPAERLVWPVTIGGPPDGLLAEGTAGQAIAIETTDAVLPAVDTAAQQLRTLHRVDATVADDVDELTLAVEVDDAAARTTVPLDAADPAGAPAPPDDAGAADDADPADEGTTTASDGTGEPLAVPWPLLVAGLLAAAGVTGVFLLMGRPGTEAASTTDDGPHTAAAPTTAAAVAVPRDGRRRRFGPHRPPRPIAKPATETRAALAGAHQALRRLALVTRRAEHTLDARLFRLTEAHASASLDGRRDDGLTTLLSALAADDEDPTDLAQRSIALLTIGWDHTAAPGAAPPPIVEFDAAAVPRRGGDAHDPSRRLVPVRALDPLLDIALEHLARLRETGPHAGVTARAATVVSVARAARLALPALTWSPWLRAHPDEYRAAMEIDPADPAARDAWLQFACRGLAAEAQACTARLQAMARLRSAWLARTDDDSLHALADLLLRQGVVDERNAGGGNADDARDGAALCDEAASLGWVERMPQTDGAWIAHEVVALFDADAADAHHTHPQYA